MILAKEEQRYQQNIEEQGIQKRVRKVKKVKRNPKVVYFGLVLIAFLLGLVIAAKQAQVAVTGYEVSELKQQLAILELENQELVMEVGKLKSLERIEKIALNELGLVKPEAYQLVVVESSNKSEAQLETAEKLAEKPREEGILQVLKGMIGSLEGRISSAEASISQ